MTLKALIKKLFNQHKLQAYRHFDVWICGYMPDSEQDIIDKEKPFECCHFLGFKKYVDMNGNRKIKQTKGGYRVKDATDLFKWLEFEVEYYEFEITSSVCEYWLFVKLDGINRPFA